MYSNNNKMYEKLNNVLLKQFSNYLTFTNLFILLNFNLFINFN